jgi:hypothetical protein
MADTKPIKVNFTSGNATSLGEFQTDETVPVENGGTGASDSANARNNLGLGDLATQDSNNVNLDGGSISGTDVDVSGATFTVANDQISGDAINGGTATPTTLNSTNLNVDSGTLFVDSVNNRVGVGTSSPTSQFSLFQGSNLKSLDFETSISSLPTDNSTPLIFTSDGNGAGFFDNFGGLGISARVEDTTSSKIALFTSLKERLNIDSNGDISFYEDTGTTPKFFWDASAERLGIGTSSPDEAFEVHQGNIKLGTDINTTSKLLFERSGATRGELFVDNSNELQIDVVSATKFSIDGSEAARIDSSGNLLVGTTDSFPASVGESSPGISLRGSRGQITSTADGEKTAIFNRGTDAGDIVEFRQDGSTVGSIGVRGDDLFINSDGGQLRFDVNGSSSANLNTAMDFYPSSDNTGDLSIPTARWKDLYLSGGVYLGGTGSANYLDDYEEGTWTVNLSGNSTAALTTGSTGHYTKIGQMVYASFAIELNTNSDTNNFKISGLPFAIGSSENHRGGIAQGWQTSGNDYISNGPENTSNFNIYDNSGNNYSFSNWSNENLKATFIYRVD